MKWPWSILPVMLLTAPAMAVETQQQRAVELQQVKADYARACAGQGRNIDAPFSEADGTPNQIRTAKGLVTFYRSATPESGDWTATDMYVFAAATGKRVQFTRAVTYAGEIFVYVKTIDANGHVVDNAHALPDGWYLTDEPIFSSLRQLCRFKPAKAGFN